MRESRTFTKASSNRGCFPVNGIVFLIQQYLTWQVKRKIPGFKHNLKHFTSKDFNYGLTIKRVRSFVFYRGLNLSFPFYDLCISFNWKEWD